MAMSGYFNNIIKFRKEDWKKNFVFGFVGAFEDQVGLFFVRFFPKFLSSSVFDYIERVVHNYDF